MGAALVHPLIIEMGLVWQSQRTDIVLALPVDNRLDTMTWLIVIIETERMVKYM